MIGTPRAAGEEDRPFVHPTAGPETPDPEQRAEVVLPAPALTIREAGIAGFGRHIRRIDEALREDDPPPAG